MEEHNQQATTTESTAPANDPRRVGLADDATARVTRCPDCHSPIDREWCIMCAQRVTSAGNSFDRA